MHRARIIDGKALAALLLKRIHEEVARLRRSERLTPGLAVVLVGNDPASEIYVRMKTQQSEAAGIKSFMHRLSADLREEDLLTLVHGLNKDHRVHGILLQLPLPPQIETQAVITAIDPGKDVDGFHVVNAGRLLAGSGDGMVPCTPLGCLRLIKSERQELTGLKALVVGRSGIVGKPMALLLLAENCTVTIAHSKTWDLAAECRSADVLVAAVGQPAMIRGDWIKEGAIVIDVGINRIDRGTGMVQMVGDVAFEEAMRVAGAITPVPGGVGPMTVACLLRNTVIAACRSREIEEPDL